MKRIVIALSLALAIGVATPSYGASDITGHWAENIIKEASTLGIVAGYEDGSYKPEAYIKREEFYTLLSKIMTVKPDTTNTTITFKDVVKGEWYEPVIKTAVAAGITSGYEDGTFGIGILMSRQEAAKVVASVIQTKDINASLPGTESVKDKNDIAPWALSYVETMFKKGYMKGDDQNMLHPTNALKRSEAITILLNVKKNEKIIAANADKLAEEQQIVAEGVGCKAIHEKTVGHFTAGEGTKRLPYVVSTEDQLNHIRNHGTEGQYFVLKNNITVTKDYATVKPMTGSDESDWTNGNFVPLGSSKDPFKGNLDGGNYSISGLNIQGISGAKSSSGTKPPANNAGLIGVMDKTGSAKNLTVESSKIEGSSYIGGVVGYNYGTVENCMLGSKSTVTGVSHVGGVVGYSNVALSNNNNKGTVLSTGQYTGGVAGYVNGSGTLLEDCTNYGSVTGEDKLGGVAGGVYSTGTVSSNVSDCKNVGQVYAGAYNSGGILGTADAGASDLIIEGCSNEGEISGLGVNGGIIGIITSKNITVKDCNNTGSVGGSGAGGIIGINHGVITNCYNEGKISSKQDAGGIAAVQQSTGRITKCYNDGTVTSDTYAGGIVGENDGYLDNSYNKNSITSTGYSGGITGRNTATIANTYNAGSVRGDTTYGTLTGRNGGSILTSYWLSSTGGSCVGMADRSNGYDPLKVRSLTERELSGQDKIVVDNKYILLTDLMNKNNLTQSDIINNVKPTELWQFNYRSTSSTGGDNSGLLDEKNKVGNIIDSSDLSNGTYLYPQLAL